MSDKKPKKDTTSKAKSQEIELELAKTKEELENLKKERDLLIIAGKQALADLQNYKRRVEESKKDIAAYALIDMVIDLLPILDNFERALKFAPDVISTEAEKSSLLIQDFVTGIRQIHSQLKQTLEKRGVKEIKSIGEKLNPERHEAVMQVKGEKDTIIEEVEKGYMLGERVIKAAKVKVGNGDKKSS